MTSTGLWSLCLVASGTRKVVKVNPATDSIEDLYRVAGEAFGNESNVESLKIGFPPQLLDSKDTTILAESKKVGNQEKVHVVLHTAEKNGKEAGKKIKGGRGTKAAATTVSPSSSPSSQPVRRPKRSAAQAASDSFKDVIREQDRILNAEKQSAKNKKAKRGTAFGSSSTARAKPAPKPKPVKFTSKEPGRRLADGVIVAAPTSKKRAAKSSSSPGTKQSKQKYEDMSVALLGALNDKGTMGRILRKGMSNAVQSTYETTKAATRLAALESRTPQESVQMERIQEGGKEKLRVRFEKGVQGKGFYEEIVDWIPEDVLRNVISSIYKTNQEGLRGHNLSFLSNRVLWALAFSHWDHEQKRQQEQEGVAWDPFSLGETYRKLLPSNDWSFLRRRKETLSAKAMENIRQQEETEKTDDPAEDLEATAEAIQEVENAMEGLHRFDSNQRAEQIANAAVARQQRQLMLQSTRSESPEEQTWCLETPSEFDEDELLQCIAASTETTVETPSESSKLLAKGLVEWALVHNWRELANQNPAELYSCMHAKDRSVDLADVEKWVEHARLESVEEIIVEICDGNPSNVEILRDAARTGTPKDLAIWKEMPDLLLEELGGAAGDSLSLDDLIRFCDRSNRALEQFKWLTWYATPVE